MNPIFVYGILKNSPGAQPARVSGYRLIDMGMFPAAVPADDSQIVGELIFVDDARVAMFDRIEGTPSFYTREKVDIEVGDGNQTELIEGEMYVINKKFWDVPSQDTFSLKIVNGGHDATTYEYTI
jgi:gamma-glutamylcyclotransferase (GGCT)/AIG2-like uncharacterized protein YtfP